jgi:hypothetical protein
VGGLVRRSTNNVIIFGTEFQQVESLADSSTTSTAFQTKLTLTTVSIPAGTYRIGWSYDWRYSTTVANFQARIVENGTVRFLHVQEPQDGAITQRQPASGFLYLILPSGVNTIEIQYSSAGGLTATIRNARLELWRVA